jgi:hypothetical protein
MIVVKCCGERSPDPGKSLICWRPRRDLNPCYRRERAFQAFCVDLLRVVLAWFTPVFSQGLAIYEHVGLGMSLERIVSRFVTQPLPRMETVRIMTDSFLESVAICIPTSLDHLPFVSARIWSYTCFLSTSTTTLAKAGSFM